MKDWMNNTNYNFHDLLCRIQKNQYKKVNIREALNMN